MGACPPLRQSDSRAPSGAPIAPLPRKRLAFSATGGASALSPLTPELQSLSHFSAPVHQRFFRRFDLLLFPLPLPLYGYVPLCYAFRSRYAFGTKTHMSFVRNPTAERQRRQGAEQIESRTLLGRQSFAQRVQHRPRRGRQWQVKGAALAFSWGRAGVVLFRKENHPCEKPRAKRGSLCFAVPPSAQNFQKILPLLHKNGRQTPPCAPFSEALRKKRSRKGEPCRKTKRAPPRAALP